MTDLEQTTNTATPLKKVKRVQAVVSGIFKVMYQPGRAFDQTKLHLIQQGMIIHETPHFLIARGYENQPTILIHRLRKDEVDNNIGAYLMRELVPYGCITSDKDFGAALIGVVISLSPAHPVEAWNLFALNTLQRLREKLQELSPSADRDDFITPFAHIYRRLLQLKVGTSLLDVGCACAFWPVLAAEYTQTTDERIVGVDNRNDAITLSNNLAAATNKPFLEFILSDLLAQEFLHVGIFDTVTAIALLEHIPEERLPQAFDHLLKVTRRRLIISVPYEEQATLAYGHQQVFTHEKLEQWGAWCVEHIQHQGHFWCEDVMGGLLVVEHQ